VLGVDRSPPADAIGRRDQWQVPGAPHCWLPAAGYSLVMPETGATCVARDANPPLLYGESRILVRLRPAGLVSRYPGHSRVHLVLTDEDVARVADTIPGRLVNRFRAPACTGCGQQFEHLQGVAARILFISGTAVASNREAFVLRTNPRDETRIRCACVTVTPSWTP
jgi:hypothetical protein